MQTCKQCKHNTNYDGPFFNGYCQDCNNLSTHRQKWGELVRKKRWDDIENCYDLMIAGSFFISSNNFEKYIKKHKIKPSSNDLMKMLYQKSTYVLLKLYIEKYNIKVTPIHYLLYCSSDSNRTKYDKRGVIILDSLLSQNNCLDAYFFKKLDKILYTSYGKRQFYYFVPYNQVDKDLLREWYMESKSLSYKHVDKDLLWKWMVNKRKLSDKSHDLPKRVLKPSLELITILTQMMHRLMKFNISTVPMGRYIFYQSILDLTLCFYNVLAWPPYVLLHIFRWLPFVDKFPEHLVVGHIIRIRNTLNRLDLVHYEYKV